MANNQATSRIESKEEIEGYIARLKYAIATGCYVKIQYERQVDNSRDEEYSNTYTIADLFPDENPTAAVLREIKTLKVEEYIKTVKDLRFPKRKEMREFGRVYNGNKDVYIKLRVELLGEYGGTTVFVMSFHYAVKPFSVKDFPYRK